METLEQKKRRLAGKVKYLDAYIKTLNKITSKKVDATMLLSIVETDKLLGPGKSVDYVVDYETTLDFCNKETAWETIRKVFGNNSLFIALNHVLSKNCLKEVVLDFYEEDGIRKIDIERRSIIKNSHIQDTLEVIKRTLGNFINELRNKKGINGYQVSQTKKSIVNCNNTLSFLLFKYIDGYHIKKDDREINFKLTLHNNGYLQFAQIGKVDIAIDLHQINELNEWNIINYNTKHVIATTFDNFFSNKVWDWIDKNKTIWK